MTQTIPFHKTAPSGPTIGGNDAAYRHQRTGALCSGQFLDGIELEINHYCDPLFRPKGMPND